MRLAQILLVLFLGGVVPGFVCAQEVAECRTALETPFDPVAIVGRHLDLNAISFRLSLNRRHEPYTLATYYYGKRVLELDFLKFYDERRIFPRTSAFRKFRGRADYFNGKGLGSLTYLIAGYILHKYFDCTFSSDELGHSTRMRVSRPARELWKRFVSSGYAKLGGLHVGFSNRAYYLDRELMDSEMYIPIRQFIKGRVRYTILD